MLIRSLLLLLLAALPFSAPAAELVQEGETASWDARNFVTWQEMPNFSAVLHVQRDGQPKTLFFDRAHLDDDPRGGVYGVAYRNKNHLWLFASGYRRELIYLLDLSKETVLMRAYVNDWELSPDRRHVAYREPGRRRHKDLIVYVDTFAIYPRVHDFYEGAGFQDDAETTARLQLMAQGSQICSPLLWRDNDTLQFLVGEGEPLGKNRTNEIPTKYVMITATGFGAGEPPRTLAIARGEVPPSAVPRVLGEADSITTEELLLASQAQQNVTTETFTVTPAKPTGHSPQQRSRSDYIRPYRAEKRQLTISTTDTEALLLKQVDPALEMVDMLGGEVGATCLAGNRAFVASGLRLTSFDATPQRGGNDTGLLQKVRDAKELKHLIFSRRITALAGTTTTLAAIDDETTLVLLDAERLSLTAMLSLPGKGSSLAATGNRIFVGGEFGIIMVDVSNPSQPKAYHSGNEPWVVTRIEANGSTAYAYDAFHGIRVVDFADPAAPAIVGAVQAPGVYRMSLVEDKLFLQANLEKAYLVGLSNPAHPTLTEIDKSEIPHSGPRLVVDNGYINLVGPDSVTKWWVWRTFPNVFERLAVSGETLLSGSKFGVTGLRLLPGGIPEQRSTVETGLVMDIDALGNRALVSTYNGDVDLLDIPSERVLSRWNGGHQVITRVKLTRNVAYAGSTNAKLQTLPIAKDTLTTGNEYSSSANYSSVWKGSGKYIYFVSGPQCMVFDSTSASTTPLNTIQTPWSFDCCGTDTTLFTVGNFGMQVWDVRDALNPKQIGELTEAKGERVNVNGNYLSVTHPLEDDYIVDVRDAAHPRLVGKIKARELYAEDAVAWNGFLYAACGTQGLAVLKMKGSE